jgi:hypothetical protein
MILRRSPHPYTLALFEALPADLWRIGACGLSPAASNLLQNRAVPFAPR